MTIVRHDNTVQPLRVEATRPRVTAAPASRRFRDALDASARTLLGGVEAASSLVPGGPVVTAAIRGSAGAQLGAGSLASAAASESAAAPGAPVSDLAASFMDDNMKYLRIQQQMQAENRRFTTLSNVMKARHETAKNAINNIR